MTNKTQIEVENRLISIVKQDEQDYICLTVILTRRFPFKGSVTINILHVPFLAYS